MTAPSAAAAAAAALAALAAALDPAGAEPGVPSSSFGDAEDPDAPGAALALAIGERLPKRTSSAVGEVGVAATARSVRPRRGDA